MQTPFPPFASLALHKGNSQNLQLIGLGTDGSLCLPAWQSHASGTWTIQPSNRLSFQHGTFSALALGTGNRGFLQVLALGADRHIYLVAWQDGSGDWHPPSAVTSGPLGDPARTYAAVTTCPGNSGFLQVFGLGTDGKIYLVVWQDQNGDWHPPSAATNGPLGDRSYSAMVAANGNSGYLQVIGLGTDQQVYLVAWQDQKGDWHRDGRLLSKPGRHYSEVVAANGNSGFLQVLALGTDRKVYLAAWQDGKGKWHLPDTYGGPLGNESRPYVALAAGMGADRNLQVLCLGTDGKLYHPAYQDKSGDWHAPSSKTYGPLGDPALSYRALVLGNGDQAGKDHPGNLQVVGLGAGEVGDGLAFLAAWQSGDGHWHAGKPLGKVRSPIVNWEGATGQKVDGGCVAFGRFWVAQGSAVISFDAISGARGRKLFPFPNNASPRAIQPYGGKLAVVCDDGNLYLADPDTGQIGFKASVGIPTWTAAQEGAVFVAGFGGVTRLGPDGSIAGPYGREVLAGAPAVANGVLYMPTHSSTFGSSVEALDATTLANLWSIGADGRPGPVFCDGSRLCFTTEHKSLYVYDVGARSPVTPKGKPIGLGAASEIQPILNDGICYVAFSDAVQAVEVATGRPGRRFAPLHSAPEGTPILNENGVLFYGSIGPIYVIDTASASAGLGTYGDGAWPFLAAWQDGALFYADSSSAAAVRLDELVHQYYAETSLIRDFDFSRGVGAATSAPNFQVEVALFDKDGSPRAGQSVRISATAPTTVIHDGRATRISPTDFLDVTVDGAGRLRVAVPAGSADRSGTFRQGLTAPELLLTSPFMDPRMRFVIRPHGQLQQQLATITQDQLHGAKGYDERAVVNDAYRNDGKAMASATGAINQMSGMVHTSMADPRKRSAGNMYCDSACDMAVACCMPASDPACRVVCDQSFSFDLTLGAAHFRLLSYEEAGAAAAALAPAAILGGWDDFWDDIKTGAAKVTSAVITAVADGAEAVIHFAKGAGNYVVKGVIGAIEQATLVVQGIFNTIASAIHRVVEAVSFLFDWTEIVDLHNRIRDEVTATWTALGTGAGGVSYAGIKAALDERFKTAKAAADAAFQTAKIALGNQTSLGAQKAASGQPNAAVGSGQDNWLLAKLQSHVVAPVAPGRQAAPAAVAGIVWPDFDPGDKVAGIFERFLGTLGDTLKGEFSATIDRVREDLDFRSSPGLLARGLSAVIDIVQGLLDAAIGVGKAVTDLLVDLLEALIGAVKEFVTHEIEIPYVSDLYEWATGNKPSLLDVFALIVAIPAGFAMKLLCRQPAYASGVSPLPPAERVRRGLPSRVGKPLPVGWITIVAGCAQTVWSVVSGVLGLVVVATEKLSPPTSLTPLDWTRLGLTLAALFLVRGAFGAAIGFHQGHPDPLVWSIWAVPTLVLVADVAAIALAPRLAKTGLPEAIAIYGAVAGFAVAVLGAIQFLNGDKTEGDGLALGFALAVGLSLVCRVVVVFPEPKVKAVGVVAGAGFLFGSGVLEVARGVLGVEREVEPAALPRRAGSPG